MMLHMAYLVAATIMILSLVIPQVLGSGRGGGDESPICFDVETQPVRGLLRTTIPSIRRVLYNTIFSQRSGEKGGAAEGDRVADNEAVFLVSLIR